MISLTRSIGAVHVLATAPEIPPAAKSAAKFSSQSLFGAAAVVPEGAAILLMIYDPTWDANEDLDLKVFEDIRGCGQIFEIFDGVRCVVVGVGVLCSVYVSQRG